MICLECNTENPNSNWYCLNCGANLREQNAPVPGKPAGTRAGASGEDSSDKIFAGRYAGLVKIGDGAMSTVYRATDTVLEQEVALKVLHAELAANRDYISRFKREIALARTITHPNVYRIYDIGHCDRQTHFISMEYVRGEELKRMLGGKPLPPEKGLPLVRQVCQAVSVAHGKGVIHRDLKPQNIMIEDETGRCVVMDFGIATGESAGGITRSGTFLGTPEYISPEQADGREVGKSTDIYSIGVIMYEMFTGRLPFGPGKPLSVALKHVNKKPDRPRKHNPGLPRALEDVILKAMAKDPRSRYPDADSLLEAVEELAQEVSPQRDREEITVQQARNPYLNRNMIRDRSLFYGRSKEVATIYSRLGAARPQSVSIVGERRIGKSSLLYYINDEHNRDTFLDDPSRYLFIFMDFQEKRRSTVDDFFGSLFTALAAEAGARLGELPLPGYDGFKQVCEHLDREDHKLVLLFDEFEAVTKNKNFEPEFFAFLRSLANNYNVAYVTSSVRNLQELCYNREISDSPFFNIFSNLNLSAFSEKEARRFVSQPSREAGHPLEEHFETVVELAGYFPFYMAIACSILFDFDFEQADPAKTVFENVEELFLDEAGMHFQFIINSLSKDEILAISRLHSGEPLGEVDRYVLRGLARRGYVIGDGTDEGARIFSRTFGRLLQEHAVRERLA